MNINQVVMTPKVSVVMPAYNAEQYIRQALDSLINQTFTDWECIIVNDGSTDNTLHIIEEYSSNESRIRYKTIERSGTAKIPRDTAVTMSRGEWILALDSDDMLATDTIEKMLSRQMETNADIVLLKLIHTDENGIVGNVCIPSCSFDFSQIMTGLNAAKLTIGKWIINGNGLIPKRLFDNRRFIKNYMNADEYDTRQMLIMADKVAFVDAHYYYRQHSVSITKSFSAKRFDCLYTDKLLQELIEASYDKTDDVIETVRLYRFRNILHLRCLFVRNSDKLLKEEHQRISSLIKENYKDIKKEISKFDSKTSIMGFFIGHDYTLFKLTTYIYSKLKK